MNRPLRVIVLIPSAREFDRGIRRGIVQYANNHGPWMFYEEAPPYVQVLSPRQRLAGLRQWRADGAIVMSERLDEVRPLGIPAVVLHGGERLRSPYARVICDNEGIGLMGAQTLLGLGLKRFAYCGLEGLEFSRVRGAMFVEAINRAGFATELYNSPGKYLGRSWNAEERHLGRWLAGLPKPVGLLACNDDRARMISGICNMQGIRIPDDVAVLGVDNDELVCRSANPPLSSVALATERAGYDAAALLAGILEGPRIAGRTITVRPIQVVTRQSTDILAIEDDGLVRALRFIRENSHRKILVPELAAAARLSGRLLRDRFQQAIGRTPLQEIHRCRVAHIARLLVETNMNVGEIAAATGFEMDAHFARFFSRQTGTTPLEYRRSVRVF